VRSRTASLLVSLVIRLVALTHLQAADDSSKKRPSFALLGGVKLSFADVGS
jgi:hypothetical protein